MQQFNRYGFPGVLKFFTSGTEAFLPLYKGTSLMEYIHKMRSGDVLAYLSQNGPSNGSFMLLMLFCSILALMSLIMFSVLFCFISVKISEIQLMCDRRTDGRTDGPTDRLTDGHTLLQRCENASEKCILSGTCQM